jgi:predicted RNase H-like nuclease (RuvC/YqgF family)
MSILETVHIAQTISRNVAVSATVEKLNRAGKTAYVIFDVTGWPIRADEILTSWAAVTYAVNGSTIRRVA